MAKDYSQQIKKLRANLGLTQHALAERLHVRPQVVASWEQGRKEPSARSYIGLARLAPPQHAWFFFGKMGVTQELVRSKWVDGKEPIAEKQTRVLPPEIRSYTTEPGKQGAEARLGFQVQIPVLRDEAAAGSPQEINEPDIEGFIAVPGKAVPKGYGAYTSIYIRGDSMEPKLGERFIVVIDHTDRDPIRLRGCEVAALVQDGVMVKLLAPESRPDRIILRSYNPAYKDIVLESPETNPIIGTIVFWLGMPRH